MILTFNTLTIVEEKEAHNNDPKKIFMISEEAYSKLIELSDNNRDIMHVMLGCIVGQLATIVPTVVKPNITIKINKIENADKFNGMHVIAKHGCSSRIFNTGIPFIDGFESLDRFNHTNWEIDWIDDKGITREINTSELKGLSKDKEIQDYYIYLDIDGNVIPTPSEEIVKILDEKEI